MSTSRSITDKKLEGKVAIITGAAGGIGAVTARLFSDHGAHVILTDIVGEPGVQLATEIGPKAIYRHCDVTKEEDIASAVDFAMEKFGKLDIMHNNAGVISSVENFENVDLDVYDRISSITVRGIIAGIKHSSRVMIPKKQGVILNTASTAALTTAATVPLAYNITKSNVPAVTRIAAFHLGKHGIRVNAISPHGTPTKMVTKWLSYLGISVTTEQVKQGFTETSPLLDKCCTEEDVAKCALFLCSDDSAYVSGHNLVVDGGWSNFKVVPAFETWN